MRHIGIMFRNQLLIWIWKVQRNTDLFYDSCVFTEFKWLCKIMSILCTHSNEFDLTANMFAIRLHMWSWTKTNQAPKLFKNLPKKSGHHKSWLIRKKNRQLELEHQLKIKNLLSLISNECCFIWPRVSYLVFNLSLDKAQNLFRKRSNKGRSDAFNIWLLAIQIHDNPKKEVEFETNPNYQTLSIQMASNLQPLTTTRTHNKIQWMNVNYLEWN